MTDEERDLAAALVAEVERRVIVELETVRTRIADARRYMSGVRFPNRITLISISHILSGSSPAAPHDETRTKDTTHTVLDLFERRWRCEVVSSGYHNGAKCTPDDPHSDWRCEYRWFTAPLTDREMADLRTRLADEQTDDTACPHAPECPHRQSQEVTS